MSFDLRVEGLEDIMDSFERIRKGLVSPEMLGRMAGHAKEAVVARTLSGKDVANAPFKPYSKKYGKTREKRGVNGTVVDLRFTGEMLGDISARQGPLRNESMVFFSSKKSAEKARCHQAGAGRNGVRRRFFGLNTAEKQGVEQILEEHINGIIKDAY